MDVLTPAIFIVFVLVFLTLSYGLYTGVQARKNLQLKLHENDLTIGRLQAENQGLEDKVHYLQDVETKNKTLQDTFLQLKTENARLVQALENEQQRIQEKVATLEDAKKTFRDVFSSLSAEALERNNREFLNLAENNFQKLQQHTNLKFDEKEKSIANLVAPLKENLINFQTKVDSLEKERLSTYQILRHQVEALNHSQKDLRKETGRLVDALKKPTVRGRWGEMQLRRVVEMAGLSVHCDFLEQQTYKNDDKILRPDMVINLPGDKQIIVDAKVPLSAYLESLESDEESIRKEKLVHHSRQVRDHIKALSQKSYWESLALKNTPEFVVLFLPGETFFTMALESDPSLIEMGIQKKVILTTPSTLIALLHAVAFGWKQERVQQNAVEISELGQTLYKRLGDLGSHFQKLGQDLRNSVKSYNRTLGTLESRILPTARKFESLKMVSHQKEISTIPLVDENTRNLQSSELRVNLNPDKKDIA